MDSSIIGRRFGRLIVVSYSHSADRQTHWNCACDCGVICIAGRSELVVGRRKSCGCLVLELRKTRWFKHGKSNLTEHYIWMGMISRCHRPENEAYYKYGGRGICVCDRWRESFEAFLSDMGPRPSRAASVDRIDNSGNYEPSNCRWATARQQSRNTRTNVWLEFNGRRQIMADWANELGVPSARICRRLKQGWSVEQALMAPDMRRGSPAWKEAQRS